ncbi:hypothetical protein M407DRAFT_28539 [Tulasnella calospora MUT 4182]|uniref:Uncharacterized protein n=1 Tax=Tulasnella calospora MUT 4182 TaxID=1051891 RepID=A0A0C3Q184_9AGAM|nr:hypothetical protein M407DRAFT_28539 [Tulasnella calospora MUT 4182]
MSSFIIAGNFSLNLSCKVFTTNPTTRHQTAHIHYLSDMHLTNKTSIPVEVRVFSNPANPIITDGTVVYIITKVAAVPPLVAIKHNIHFYLEAMSLSPYPGNPTDPNYDDFTPDNIVPWCWAIGLVATETLLLADNKSHGFDLSVSGYGCDATVGSSIRCRFEGSNGCWAHSPLKPNVSSVIQVCGPLAGIFASSHLELMIEHIILSLGTNTDASPISDSPSKKRKYAAVTPANTTLPSPTAVEATAQGLPAPATTSTTTLIPPMAAVEDSAALSEATLNPATDRDPGPTAGPSPATPVKPSKYKGKGKSSKV